MDKEKLYKEAIAFWGKEKQLRMVQEECAELILAVSHYLRKVESEKNWENSGLDNLIEETADVLNMVEQCRCIVGENQVDEIRWEKLAKVEAKLKKYKERETEK